MDVVPTVTIEAFPPEISQGESFELSWGSSNGQYAYIDNDIGEVALSGSMVLSPEQTTLYILTVTGEGGSASAQVQVRVLGNPEPQPEGSFGWNYQDLVPADATVQEYAPDRFSVITGMVEDVTGAGLAGVSVGIHNHPEYGTALTGPDGGYSIPVEGGGVRTLVFQKEGYLCAHRKVDVPWNDIAIVDTLKMTSQDPVATAVTFDGDPNTVITHKSSEVADEFGSRSCTLVFQGDNRAYALDEDGNEMFELESISARATEFVTQDVMPARLPSNSGYTYCAELSADGIKNVVFEKPVVLWVSNFLGFEVGEVVPVGYYDRGSALWVPSDNGVVVKLLDEDGDGVVDALDATGDNFPDDLNNNGSYADEVKGLTDPAIYLPGNTLFRVAVYHFTPFDLNWPYGPSEEAIPPNAEGESNTDQKTGKKETCKEHNSSYVEERNRILHEDIPIPGTDMSLHYSSSRAPGYMTVITVPASGESVPESLTGIRVEIDVAGNRMVQNLTPQPNQTAVFAWDRLDYLGRPVNRKTTAKVAIGFVYNAVYYRAGDFDQAFAKFGCTNYGCQMTTVRSRQEVCIWKRYEMDIMARERVDFLEGWSLSKHHFMDDYDYYTLHKGDGSVCQNSVHIIETSAGTGASGYSGDGGPAIEADLNEPFGLAVDPSGSIYIADRYNDRIRKVDGDGVITTVAGNGSWGYSGDGGLAIDASLNFPNDVAAGPDGSFYFADTLNHCIRKVNREGIITTVAGNGTPGYSGDGGPASDAQLYEPIGVTVDASGNIFIAELGNHCIRMVDSSGIIITVAGNGTPGFSGDGGSAHEAQLQYPSGVAVDTNGNIYIADCSNHRIRKVDRTGIITTVAGTGTGGYNGDGIAAVEARLSYPYGISVDSAGALYISDTYNHRVRKVDMKGIISTVAGQGTPGYEGDGEPAGSALLNYPIRTAFDGSGRLIIADTTNKRIREVGPIASFSGNLTSGETAFVEEDGEAHIMTSRGLHKETIDLHTGITLREFAYDQDNHLISTVDRFGNQITIQRDATGVPTSIVSPDGLVTTLTIDGNGFLSRISYPDGSDYNFEYSPDGLLTAKTEPRGNRFEYHFDPQGRLTETMDEEGGHWVFSRAANANGDILSQTTTGEGNLTSYLDHTDSTGAYTSTITDPTGALTFFFQSADDLTVNKSFSCGMELEFKYDLDPVYRFKYVKEMTETMPSGLEKTTLRQKSYWDIDFDEIPDVIFEAVEINGKLTLLENIISESRKYVISHQGRFIMMNYDPQTLLTTTVSIPGLYDISYGYDPRGRITSVTNNTRQKSFTYNAEGFLASVTDPKNHTTTYTYDPVGRVTGINRPDGSSLGFTYDLNGNMTVLTNPADVSHLFGYNKVDLNSTYQTPISGTYTYVYGKDRRLVQTNFPSGFQINNIYDKTRLMQIQTPEGNIDLTYLCGSKVGSVTKGSESISYTYDGSLMTSETLAGVLNQTLSYGYNIDFDLDSFTYAGHTESYAYDNDGLLTGAGVFTISRNAGNGLPEGVVGGALDLTRSFNGYGEVAQESCRVGAQNVSLWNLTRDDTGRITHRTETIEGVPSHYDYTYDPMGRLLTVTKDGVLVEEYQYGPNGARIYETNTLRGITGRDLSYYDGDHLLTAGDVSYLYDVDGYLYTKTLDSDVTTYTYSSSCCI
ncbi:MAG: SMP-30/gluconolactonase/LRE family protein [Deltaproteobacteria bacterium]|nr:SMP-30/gluconolactonase/LRE family protein [Deltaproteobacteria bacterium]